MEPAASSTRTLSGCVDGYSDLMRAFDGGREPRRASPWDGVALWKYKMAGYR